MVVGENIKCYECQENTIPIAGYFIRVKENSEYNLTDAKKILESQKFREFVQKYGTPTNMGSYRISCKTIEKFYF